MYFNVVRNLLSQLDGVACESEERLLIVGATNRPQEIDEAARLVPFRIFNVNFLPYDIHKARLRHPRVLTLSSSHINRGFVDYQIA